MKSGFVALAATFLSIHQDQIRRLCKRIVDVKPFALIGTGIAEILPLFSEQARQQPSFLFRFPRYLLPMSVTMDDLYRLARRDDVVGLQQALVRAKKQGLDVNQRDRCGSTILHHAAGAGLGRNIAAIVVGAGKAAGFHSVNACDKEGGTALHLACLSGDTDAVLELTERSGRAAGFTAFAAHGKDGRTALHFARDEETVRGLVEGASAVSEEERHALVHAVDRDGWTALHNFAWIGRARGLLRYCTAAEWRFLVTARDEDGQTALHRAAYHRDEDVVKFLVLENGNG